MAYNRRRHNDEKSPAVGLIKMIKCSSRHKTQKVYTIVVSQEHLSFFSGSIHDATTSSSSSSNVTTPHTAEKSADIFHPRNEIK